MFRPRVAPDVMCPAAVTLTDSRAALDFEKLTSVLFAFPTQRLDEYRRFHMSFFLAVFSVVMVGHVFVPAFFFDSIAKSAHLAGSRSFYVFPLIRKEPGKPNRCTYCSKECDRHSLTKTRATGYFDD
jgi:hypothetical protein